MRIALPFEVSQTSEIQWSATLIPDSLGADTFRIVLIVECGVEVSPSTTMLIHLQPRMAQELPRAGALNLAHSLQAILF